MVHSMDWSQSLTFWCDNHRSGTKQDNWFVRKLILVYCFVVCLQMNTFQVVVATDGVVSFVMFNYDYLDWTTTRNRNSIIKPIDVRNLSAKPSFVKCVRINSA